MSGQGTWPGLSAWPTVPPLPTNDVASFGMAGTGGVPFRAPFPVPFSGLPVMHVVLLCFLCGHDPLFRAGLEGRSGRQKIPAAHLMQDMNGQWLGFVVLKDLMEGQFCRKEGQPLKELLRDHLCDIFCLVEKQSCHRCSGKEPPLQREEGTNPVHPKGVHNRGVSVRRCCASANSITRR